VIFRSMMADRCIVRSLLGAKNVCGPSVSKPRGISCYARRADISCEVKTFLDHSLRRKLLPMSCDRNFYDRLVTEYLLTLLFIFFHSKLNSVWHEQTRSNF
jgi:hypothetical protein